MNPKTATAYHEAGHAVIGRVLGLACGGVSIVRNEDEAGHAVIHDPWDTISRWDAEAQALVERGAVPLKCREPRSAFRGVILARMAGAEAETVLLGCCAGRDGYDRREIEMMARSAYSGFSDEAWACYEPRMRRQAQRLIRRHHEKSKHVAEALLERQTLGGAEIDALILQPGLQSGCSSSYVAKRVVSN